MSFLSRFTLRMLARQWPLPRVTRRAVEVRPFRCCDRDNRTEVPTHGYELHSTHGATLVEFAMSASVLFMFLLLGLDVINFGFHTVTTQYVLNKAARNSIARTAAGYAPGRLPLTPAERISSTITDIIDIGRTFGLDLSTAAITICPISRTGAVSAGCPPNDPGDGKDFVRISLRKPYNFVFGAFQYQMDLYVVAKNEPF